MALKSDARGGSPLIFPPKLPIEDGLVLYLPFQEGSGRFTADLSGKDNHCTLDGVSWDTAKGKKGFAPTFDGINDKGTFSTNMIPSSGDFTVMGWLYCEGEQAGSTDYRGTCFGATSWTGSNVRGFVVNRNVQDLQLVWGDNSSGDSIVLVPNINGENKQTWYHAAGIYKAATTTMYGYINAGLINSKMQAYGDAGVNFEIGHCPINTSEAYWYGQLENIRIYNWALSVSELRKIYEDEK